MTHTPYLPDGTCRFCHTATQHGGLPHAPACVYANTLHALSAIPLTALESAVTLYAEVVLAAFGYFSVTYNVNPSRKSEEAETNLAEVLDKARRFQVR